MGKMYNRHAVHSAAILAMFLLAILFPCAVYAENSEPFTGENSYRYRNGVPIYDEEEALYWEDFFGSSAVSFFSNSDTSVTRHGIDVSHHQGKIDWEQVKNSGVEFAVIRCGIGGEYDGIGENKQDDAYWDYNVSECERLGIPYGVYLYSYATNTDMAASEARHTLALLEGHEPQLPVFLDLEHLDKKGKPLNSPQMYGDIAQVWCDAVSAAGYKVGIYSYTNFFNQNLTDPRLDNPNWYRWVADTTGTCTYSGRYDMWQFTHSAIVPGIDSYVDGNIWYGDFPTQKGPSLPDEMSNSTGNFMLRLYNPNSGEHFYTGSREEAETLISLGWNYEGVAWAAPGFSDAPVYRVYNPVAGDHHYTLSMDEVKMLEEAGWRYEGIAWYSGGDVPLYRLYNPNAWTGTHHYTTSAEERDFLASIGWRYEGIGWYGAA